MNASFGQTHPEAPSSDPRTGADLTPQHAKPTRPTARPPDCGGDRTVKIRALAENCSRSGISVPHRSEDVIVTASGGRADRWRYPGAAKPCRPSGPVAAPAGEAGAGRYSVVSMGQIVSP